MTPSILVVDADPSVRTELRRLCSQAGFEVETAEDGETALSLLEVRAFDLVVLAIMLPGLDGLTVCRRMRSHSTAPILILSSKATVTDRVAGLDAGADDYLVKPHAASELLARIRALLRRYQTPQGEELSYADITLQVKTHEVHRSGQPIRLSPTEFHLLSTFLRHPRQVLSRAQLCQAVWGVEFEGESNFVDVTVKDLRKKLEAGGHPRVIQTLRGLGYSLRED
jgi:two-component system, OmpR family, response regulator MprA